VLAHALVNTFFSSSESYAVRCGSTFVNEYPRRDTEGSLSIGEPDDPNHLLGTYPYLFPYAMGGFEVSCTQPLSYESHASWALCYADRHFQLDTTFMFQVFGVVQKCQICCLASLQVKKQNFHAFE